MIPEVLQCKGAATVRVMAERKSRANLSPLKFPNRKTAL